MTRRCDSRSKAWKHHSETAYSRLHTETASHDAMLPKKNKHRLMPPGISLTGSKTGSRDHALGYTNQGARKIVSR